MSSRRLFIYFRVARDHEVAVVAALRGLQSAWRADMPGLRCDLLRRSDEAGDAVTLMETYTHDDGVSVAWQQRIEIATRASLDQWLLGERHIEVFESCA